MNLNEQIKEERDRIAELDAKLDKDRTPIWKERLLFASHLLDDAESCGNPQLAADCIYRAAMKRQEVEKAFGMIDPNHAVEV